MTIASFHNADLPNRKAQSVPALFSKHTPGKKYMYFTYELFSKQKQCLYISISVLIFIAT